MRIGITGEQYRRLEIQNRTVLDSTAEPLKRMNAERAKANGRQLLALIQFARAALSVYTSHQQVFRAFRFVSLRFGHSCSCSCSFRELSSARDAMRVV